MVNVEVENHILGQTYENTSHPRWLVLFPLRLASVNEVHAHQCLLAGEACFVGPKTGARMYVDGAIYISKNESGSLPKTVTVKPEGVYIVFEYEECLYVF